MTPKGQAFIACARKVYHANLLNTVLKIDSDGKMVRECLV